MERIKIILEKLFEVWNQVQRQHILPVLIFSIFSIGLIALGLAAPWRDSPVRVKGDVVEFALDCAPAALNIQVGGRTPNVREAAVYEPGSDNRSQYGVSRAKDGDRFVFHLLANAEPAMADKQQRQILGKRANLRVSFQGASSVDVYAIEIARTQEKSAVCPALRLTGQDLRQSSTVKEAKLLRFRLIQEVIGDWCRDANDLVGNWVIVAMASAALWLLFQTLMAASMLLSQSDATLSEYIEREYTTAPTDLRKAGRVAVLTSIYDRKYARFAFARAVGPAVGFAMTVMALVAALHPSAQANSDPFEFVSALQVAMTATLVGLAIRIIAELAIRLERAYLYRAVKIGKAVDGG